MWDLQQPVVELAPHAAKSCSYPSSRAAGHAEQHAGNGSVCLNSAGKCCWMVLDVKEGRELALAAKPVSQNGRAEWEQGTAGESTKGGCEGGKLVGNLAGSRAAGERRVAGSSQVNRGALRG